VRLYALVSPVMTHRCDWTRQGVTESWNGDAGWIQSWDFVVDDVNDGDCHDDDDDGGVDVDVDVEETDCNSCCDCNFDFGFDFCFCHVWMVDVCCCQICVCVARAPDRGLHSYFDFVCASSLLFHCHHLDFCAHHALQYEAMNPT